STEIVMEVFLAIPDQRATGLGGSRPNGGGVEQAPGGGIDGHRGHTGNLQIAIEFRYLDEQVRRRGRNVSKKGEKRGACRRCLSENSIPSRGEVITHGHIEPE